MSAGRIVVETHLERNQPLVAQFDRLDQLTFCPIPKIEPTAVLAGLDVFELEAGLTVFGAAHSLLTMTLCRG